MIYMDMGIFFFKIAWLTLYKTRVWHACIYVAFVGINVQAGRAVRLMLA